jgi:hypothetical protein
MGRLGFAMMLAHDNGATFEQIADALNLPLDWVQERIYAAELCLAHRNRRAKRAGTQHP